ncbi:MAG TPA: alpha/beta hydrolase [Candidatus Dormibacteraeota bacterium]|nr:alpha/beta hydrolase [Candidatus Dormibacteraeota bacterium]
MVTRTRALVSAAALGLILTTAGQPVPAAAAQAAVPLLTWADCGGGFQCSTALVPLDYQQPLGRSITLSVIRLPAGDPAHRIGSLFMNPGGPGGSGVAFLRAVGQFFPAELRARFDLVSFDPRGVASSTPVQCFPSFGDELRFFASLPPFPVTPQEDVAFIDAFAQFDAFCEARNADLLPHMSTANAARDMNLLRQAVGDERLTYLGFSYGTYLGATYVNLFPDRVRAVTLDGVIEPIEWATGRGNQADRLPFSTRLKSDDGAYETLQQFFALCAQAGSARCAFADGSAEGSQALDHKFDTLTQRLLQAPVVVPTPGGPVTVTYAIAVRLTLGALYSPSVWPQLAAALQELWLASGGGAVGALRQTLAMAAAGTAAQPYPNGMDAFASIVCADSDNPHDPFAWPRAAAEADHRAPFFGAAWTFVSMPCANWAARDQDRYTGPWDRPTSRSVLLVGNFFDPATRYESALALSHELANARLLSLDGWGHTAYAKSACIEQNVDRYLLAGQLPAPRTVCRPDQLPFGLSTSPKDRTDQVLAVAAAPRI